MELFTLPQLHLYEYFKNFNLKGQHAIFSLKDVRVAASPHREGESHGGYRHGKDRQIHPRAGSKLRMGVLADCFRLGECLLVDFCRLGSRASRMVLLLGCIFRSAASYNAGHVGRSDDLVLLHVAEAWAISGPKCIDRVR